MADLRRALNGILFILLCACITAVFFGCWMAEPDVPPPQPVGSTAEDEEELPPWMEGSADLPADAVIPVGADPHDSKWGGLVRQLNKTPHTCEACGCSGPQNWHHKLQWILCVGDKQYLRYERSNLISLCTCPTHKCHWIFGHLGVSWNVCNPNVAEDAATHLKRVTEARQRLEKQRGSHSKT